MVAITALEDVASLPTRDGSLLLRRYAPGDAEVMFALIDRNRAHLSQYGENTAEKYPTLERFVKSITYPENPHRLRLGIWKDDLYVGSINLTPKIAQTAEIGYYLGAEFAGNGYMTSAVQTLTSFALENGFSEVFAIVHPGNSPSMRVLRRAGYREDGLYATEEGPRVRFSRTA